MTNKLTIKLFAIVAVVLLGWTQNVWANVIVNGGFEDPLGVGWTYDKVERTAGIIGSTTYFNPYEGAYSLDLEYSGSGDLSGYIRQTLNTVAGETYSLHFAMGGNYWEWSDYIKNPINPAPTFETKYLEAFWNSSSLGVFSYNLHPGDTITSFTWDLHQRSVTAAGNDILEFRSITPLAPGYGAFIDAVALTAPVPEPSAMLLLGLGLIGLAGVRRKLQK